VELMVEAAVALVAIVSLSLIQPQVVYLLLLNLIQ
jgi:hypothetical protein